ncbi:hypothetical protein SAMN05660649_04218 [Desulfotomaculum arcticum]|uniref:DUF1287 domain-containing protein n=1 Tax=Desulfotruncus arcticus DSM 17038 TaxID=1121424 RepID=A0A1I2XZX3_9FIRM|nr:DUF1287 domain-containing protein [Desulfotruncus arcticus]SFH19024.1 hypothetical protein SAMN05660649_04218 [Desulfotomaculum arcticum] [Desulfotruncus arcticus DSM 17038]
MPVNVNKSGPKNRCFLSKDLGVVCFLFVVLFLAAGCSTTANQPPGEKTKEINKPSPSPVELIPEEKLCVYDLAVLGARQEVINAVSYDAAYRKLDYPDGDVPPDRGACTDVVIRAYRNAGIDLQKLIHEDMQAAFKSYPQNWGLDGPDPNIDHRRVPNQMKFFERHGQALTLSTAKADLADWQWGDVVYWKFTNGLEHCGIISDRKNDQGMPLAIHNAGLAREEDCLERWEIIGHYRYP